MPSTHHHFTFEKYSDLFKWSPLSKSLVFKQGQFRWLYVIPPNHGRVKMAHGLHLSRSQEPQNRKRFNARRNPVWWSRDLCSSNLPIQQKIVLWSQMDPNISLENIFWIEPLAHSPYANIDMPSFLSSFMNASLPRNVPAFTNFFLCSCLNMSPWAARCLGKLLEPAT